MPVAPHDASTVLAGCQARPDRAAFDGIAVPGGISRRAFIGFCTSVTAALALPATMAPDIARAVAAAPRIPVVWLALQDCTGDSESFLRSFSPTVTTLLFDLISLDYHETLMVPAGHQAAASLAGVLARPKTYITIVEGSIPTGAGGAYCTIGGETALSLVRRVVAGSLVTIAAGACSVDGGLAAAAPNPTAATGVAGAVPGVTNLINMPGCPVNGVNLVAAIAYYLTYKALPALDSTRRPLFAYGNEIHGSGRCERYQFYDADLFVRAWGDAGHRKGYCLLHMGCRGPSTRTNCYTRNWNQTSWPIGAGHPCIGCTTSKFWDRNTPFYASRD